MYLIDIKNNFILKFRIQYFLLIVLYKHFEVINNLLLPFPNSTLRFCESDKVDMTKNNKVIVVNKYLDIFDTRLRI